MAYYPPLNLPAVVVGLSLVAVIYSVRRRRTPYADLTLPPGPRRLPFVGNLFSLPQSHDWLAYQKWGREIGSDILHVDICGSHVVVLNSAVVAAELFYQRSGIYSDRPAMSALNVILGFDWVLAFMPFGSKWRGLRQAFYDHFQPSATLKYRPIEERTAQEFLRHLLDSPDDFIQHIKQLVGSAIMSIGYGIPVQPRNDPFLDTGTKALQALNLASTPSALILDVFPICESAYTRIKYNDEYSSPEVTYMPSWFPGASFKWERKRWNRHVVGMIEDPFDTVQSAVADGTQVPCIASSMLEGAQGKRSGLAKQIPANIHLAGIDTMASSLASFILSMALHPDIRKKAQQELDSVLHGERLPTFEDQAALPYLDAVVKEVLRWRPAVPMGIPHRLLTDDEYQGYYIPSGTTVMGNVWAILHDPSVYPNPDQFMPERFLDGTAPDPDAVFGFSRRACPGQHMARDVIWITAASILAAFDITPCGDVDASPESYTSGIISYPAPFRCTIRTRSKAVEALIVSVVHMDL
ncbi:cytochrome P450 [Artomyces pyxidatus]|uniref:Cytochrome P450 n=1 Tax=Artomyces pyxidatus TaxID=48021 RepID=A0ACB8SNM7_9AGAM|nr:cytochrome P450 [Artomyces pyxidatus]